MNRNLTPRPVKATGAKDAHGSILDPAFGSLYVHMHRESGLAHRHYVLKPWQVRLLRLLLSAPMRLVYVVALVTWGWMATQAARVPLLQQRVGLLTRDAGRLDTLTIRLSELQDRYDQVQRMLGAAQAATIRDTARATTPTTPAARPSVSRDTTRGAGRDTVPGALSAPRKSTPDSAPADTSRRVRTIPPAR